MDRGSSSRSDANHGHGLGVYLSVGPPPGELHHVTTDAFSPSLRSNSRDHGGHGTVDPRCGRAARKLPLTTTPAQAPADVLDYRGDPARDGVMPGPGPTGATTTMRWTYQASGPIISQVAVAAGDVLLLSSEGTLHDIDVAPDGSDGLSRSAPRRWPPRWCSVTDCSSEPRTGSMHCNWTMAMRSGAPA